MNHFLLPCIAISVILLVSPLRLSLPVLSLYFLLNISFIRSKLDSFLSYLLFRTNKFKRFFWLQVYKLLSTKNQSDSWKCMNYGYASSEGKLIESESEEFYCLQLYHFIASGMLSFRSLENKHLLEVGSGRGGGLEYVFKTFKPASATGVDYCQNQVNLCRNFYSSIQGLKFVQGDAENLPLPDQTFDAVINIESSHCYGRIDCFFDEVFRVLKKKGIFLYTDLMKADEKDKREKSFERLGFKVIKIQDITENVVRSMDLEQERKFSKIKNFNWFTRCFLDQFVGLQGSKVYQAFVNREWLYVAYFLEK